MACQAQYRTPQARSNTRVRDLNFIDDLLVIRVTLNVCMVTMAAHRLIFWLLANVFLPPDQNVAQRYARMGLFYPFMPCGYICFIFSEMLQGDLVLNKPHQDIGYLMDEPVLREGRSILRSPDVIQPAVIDVGIGFEVWLIDTQRVCIHSVIVRQHL